MIGIRDRRLRAVRADDRAAAPGSSVSPNYPQVTLILALMGPHGGRVDGDIGVQDDDDDRRYSRFVSTVDGEVRLSVPKGRYSFVGDFYTTDPATGHRAYYQAIVHNLSVNADKQRVVLSEQKATATPTFATPRRAGYAAGGVDLELHDLSDKSDGYGLSDVFGLDAGDTYHVTPTPAPRIGHSYLSVFANLVSPPGQDVPYRYDLGFHYVGAIPASLAERVRRGQLASIDTRFYGDTTRHSVLYPEIVYPEQIFTPSPPLPLPTPSRLTQYVNPTTDKQYAATLFPTGLFAGGSVNTELRTYTAGHTYREDWLRGPLAPDTVRYNSTGRIDCTACRTDNQLTVDLPVVDTTPDHYGSLVTDPAGPVSQMQVYQDGRQIYDQPDIEAATVDVPSGRHSYRVVRQVDRSRAGYTKSTHSTTDVRFVSSGDNGATKPAGWYCDAQGPGRCSILPLLTARVFLPTSLDDQLPAGATDVDFSVGHIQAAHPIPLTSATFAISFDGIHFAHVPVKSLGAGHFRAHLTLPPSARGKSVAVRVGASDAAGGSITKTTLDAFSVTAGATDESAVANSTPPAHPATFRRPSCAAETRPGHVHCFARYRPVSPGQHPLTATSSRPADSLGPVELAAAYHLSGTTSPGATVAIVDAYDDPRAEADLAIYRKQAGLAPCTTANGCFRKLNQRGAKGPLPMPDSGWGVEIALDLDAVSAACPACKIALVEGDDDSIDSLGQAEDTAAALGAATVSNSYGADESSLMSRYRRHYEHRGVTVVASTGDNGFGPAAFPAVLPSTIAVGGTSLTRATKTTRGWVEKAWDGAGSGCSAYIAKPSWQHDRHCPMRTVADVSAVADPDSGFVAYDTYGLGEYNGYIQIGGTSLSAPVIAAMVARSGRTLSNAGYIYRHRQFLNDVTAGSNGYCGNDYLCTGKRGYDAPTGNGTPNGVGAL